MARHQGLPASGTSGSFPDILSIRVAVRVLTTTQTVDREAQPKQQSVPFRTRVTTALRSFLAALGDLR